MIKHVCPCCGYSDFLTYDEENYYCLCCEMEFVHDDLKHLYIEDVPATEYTENGMIEKDQYSQ